MKLTLPREDLLKLLSLVSGAVDRRQTFPILANVMMVVDNSSLQVRATDLEIELVGRGKLTSSENVEQGEITVAARKLMEICRAIPDNQLIQLNLDHDRLLVQSGKSRFSLAVLPTKGFPSLERGSLLTSISMPQYQLKKLISLTYFSIGQEDVRYYLNGMLIEIDKDNIKLTGADSHRLSMASSTLPKGIDQKVRLIVPRKGILELMRLLEDADSEVKISLGANHIVAETDDFTFVSKLIDVQAPHYERIIPKTCNKVVIVNREQLKQVLMRVSILASEKHHGIRLAVSPNLMKVSANNLEQEEAEEELEVIYSGDAFEWGYKGDYLLEALNVLPEGEIKMSFFDLNEGVLIESQSDEQSRYFIMPLRL